MGWVYKSDFPSVNMAMFETGTILYRDHGHCASSCEETGTDDTSLMNAGQSPRSPTRRLAHSWFGRAPQWRFVNVMNQVSAMQEMPESYSACGS